MSLKQSRSFLITLKFLSICLWFLLGNLQTAEAWDLELGFDQLMPKLSTGEQLYKSGSGTELRFKPVIHKTVIGQSANIGLVFDNVSFHFQQALYRYETTIPAENAVVIDDTAAKIEVREQRVGLNYYLERELAGMFAGIGITREVEKISTSGEEWLYEADVPFLKFGIDMILGMWRIRIEQIHFNFGEHSAKINSIGVMIYL